MHRRKLVSIQYLRAIAALSVVAYHIAHQAVRLGYDGPALIWARGGVDLFFVISGFIMVATALSGDATPLPQRFFRDRLARIAPIYWLASVLAILLGGWTGWHSVASFLFMPMVNPDSGKLWPVLVPGWTLNYEMFFYLCFACCLYLPRRWIIPVCMLWLAALVGAGLVFDLPPAVAFYTRPLILEFALGMMIGLFWLKGHLPAARLGIPAGIVLLVLLDGVSTERLITLGLPAALIVAGALAFEDRAAGLANAPLLLLGDASYSIYLFHGFAMMAIRNLAIGANMHWAIYAPLAFCLSTALGIVAFRTIERPLQAMMRGAARAKSEDIRAGAAGRSFSG